MGERQPDLQASEGSLLKPTRQHAEDGRHTHRREQRAHRCQPLFDQNLIDENQIERRDDEVARRQGRARQHDVHHRRFAPFIRRAIDARCSAAPPGVNFGPGVSWKTTPVYDSRNVSTSTQAADRSPDRSSKHDRRRTLPRRGSG